MALMCVRVCMYVLRDTDSFNALETPFKYLIMTIDCSDFWLVGCVLRPIDSEVV